MQAGLSMIVTKKDPKANAKEEPQWTILRQGAEAKLYMGEWHGRPAVCKERFAKTYRHPSLDRNLTDQRTRSEVRAIMKCRARGIKTPALYFVDMENHKIYMEHIYDSVTVRDHINKVMSSQYGDAVTDTLRPLAEKIGKMLARMHMGDIIHGDLTTSNMLLKFPTVNLNVYLIDFGLGYIQPSAEDKGVDLYVLERAMLSSHPNTEEVFQIILSSYKAAFKGKATEILDKFNEVRQRGRKRTMVG